jgi:hypothetical protein
MLDTRAALSVLLATGLALVAPASAGAKKHLPALKATVTVTGHTSGSQSVTTRITPTDCPAQDIAYKTTGEMDWSATFKSVLIPLAKLTASSPARKAPKASGGITGGSFHLEGSFLQDGEYPSCPTRSQYSADATLAQASGVAPRWAHPNFQGKPGYDLFQLATGQLIPSVFTASPESFHVPAPETPSSGAPGTDERVAQGVPFYSSGSPKLKQSLEADVGGLVVIDWNKFLAKMRSLGQGQTLKLSAPVTYAKSFAGGRNSSGFLRECEGADPSSDSYDPTIVSCDQSTTTSYDIEITRVGKTTFR